ncbi:putative secreted protein [Trichoderma lentiforme]|uniref:Secreted protein n=1 Tax=Trichoderma lentiforme TaxID=1567552 RepID=A0A9P4XCN5_9HYPO|nr:putative secreted protein [Trichoderma lentiforme]
MHIYAFLTQFMGLASVVAAKSYFTITLHAPQYAILNGKVINARDRSFIIGAQSPSTRCDLKDLAQCPAGDSTLVNDDMSFLASAAPGGQFVYVAPDGSISYPPAHSSLRPPGAQVGGFHPYLAPVDNGESVHVLNWRSNDGTAGLWACPVSPGAPIAYQAVLKAATARFNGLGCLAVDGIRIQPAGNDFGAWEYT